MPSRGEKYNSDRAIAYMRTYRLYKIGFVTTYDGNYCRAGFLYQEPNPDYDKWLPENCTPILFKDWLKDIIPPDLPKPKLGKRGRNNRITPRPIVNVDTGKFYYSSRQAKKDYPTVGGFTYYCCGSRNYGGNIFCHDCRWTFIDPFMEWDDRPWTGIIHYSDDRNPSCGNKKPLYIEETGEEFDSVKEAAEELGMSYACIARAVRDGKPYNGLTFIRIKKERSL